MNKCVLCGSKKHQLLFEVDQREVAKCSRCGLVRTLDKAGVNYKEYHRDEDYEAFKGLFRNFLKKRYKIVSRFASRGKVLDIGASTGILLEIFKEHGWETWAVEPSGSSRLARKRGAKVLKTTIEKAALSNNYFNAVVLNHTFEHLENPILVLRKVKRVLKKGGVVLIDVPNFNSLSARFWKKRWPFLLPQEHLYHFTRETLEKVLVKAGLTPIYSESRSGLLDLSDPVLELWQSLTSLKKRFFTNLIGLPGALVATLLNKGAAVTVVGRK